MKKAILSGKPSNKMGPLLILFTIVIGVLSIWDQVERSRKIDEQMIELQFNIKELERILSRK
jgi:hypothetical protein